MPSQTDPQQLQSNDENDTSAQDNILELYKLEYTTGAKRHDDIYKSMWTNFSYMAILAGGILTFGKDQLTIEFLVIVACLPLIFWFWSSFLPLDRYGNLVARRMAEIEKFINQLYFKKIDEQSLPDKIDYNEDKVRKGLFLYTDFESRKDAEFATFKRRFSVLKWLIRCISFAWLAKWLEENVRVRHPIWFFSICLHIVLIISFVNWRNTNYQIINVKKNETTEKKLESINDTLQNLSNSMNGLKGSIENHIQTVNNINSNTNAAIQNQTNSSEQETNNLKENNSF